MSTPIYDALKSEQQDVRYVTITAPVYYSATEATWKTFTRCLGWWKK